MTQSQSSGSSGDPPGGFFSQPRLLRTPFGRMLQQLQLRPNTPEAVQSSVPTTTTPNEQGPTDPESFHHVYVPRVTDVSSTMPPPSTTHRTFSRPDPDASVSSPPDSDLSAYSPYTREVILRGGDQSVIPSTPSIVDTVEAAEEALYEAGITPGGSLLEGEIPIPRTIIATPPRLTRSRASPEVPPGITLSADDLYVEYRTHPTSDPVGTVVKASYSRVSHPFLRGFVGPDRCSQQSRKRFYVVRRGWHPGIYTQRADAWVRIADFRALTGHPPEFAGASSYDAAVRYLGWDPHLSPSRGPFPPADTVPFVRGPWPSTTTPSPLSGSFASPSPVPSGRTSLAMRLEAALQDHAIAPSTFADVVRHFHAASPSDVRDSGGVSSSSSIETPEGKLRREQKGFPEYPATAFTGEAFDQFYESVRNILHMPHWHLADGSTIPGHTTTPSNDQDRLISQQLHYHLAISIQAKRNPVALGVLTEMRTEGGYGDGIKLLESLRAIAYPTTTSTFLHDFDTWNRLTHRNREDLTTFYRRAKEARTRLQTHDYEISDLQFRVRFYYLVVKGPYGYAMRTLEEEFKCNRLDLFSISTQELFITMHQEFREHCYKSRTSMEVIDGKTGQHQQAKARRVDAGGDGTDQDGFTQVGAMLSSDDAKQQHCEYKCLMCKILRKGNRKGGKGVHSTARCPILKECGFTVDYNYEKDKVNNPDGKPSSFPSGRRAQSDSGGLAAPSRDSPRPTVDTVDSTSEAERNDDGPCKPPTPLLTRCDVGAPLTPPIASSLQDDDVLSVSTDEDGPLCMSDLEPPSDSLDELIANGNSAIERGLVARLLAEDGEELDPGPEPLESCRRGFIDSSPSSGRPLLCPDSGATSDMFWDRRVFLDSSYRVCHDRYVEMGDGSRVPILGSGTVKFQLAGQVVRLSDCLHVPSLDVNLLSIRTHRRRGPGCTFLADADGMFLTFPSFTVEVDDAHDPLIPIYRCLSTATPVFEDTHGSALLDRAHRVAARPVRTRSQTQSSNVSPLPSSYVADTGSS